MGALIGVALLHGLWDAMRGFALYAALVITGSLATVQRQGRLPLGDFSVVSGLALVAFILGLAVVTALGLLFLFLAVWLHRTRTPAAPTADAQVPG